MCCLRCNWNDEKFLCLKSAVDNTVHTHYIRCVKRKKKKNEEYERTRERERESDEKWVA